MFNNASNVDASHSTFSEVHRDQYIHSRTHIQGNQTVNTIIHGNQIFELGSSGIESLLRASVTSAAFDSIDRHPAPTCLPGTRIDLLARLGEWVDNPDADQRICWLSGLAGSGKSAVAQTIAEKYASQNRLAASFFFSRKEILRRTAQKFFPTLACQMLAFAPSIKPAIVSALNEDYTIPTKVLVEQMRGLLQAPISSVQNSFPDPVLIVIDSLDECDDEKLANEVVVLLADLLRTCHWPLRVLFTSRAEPHIVQTFQQSDLRGMTRSLQLQDFSVDDDIRSYLRYSFEDIRQHTGTMSESSLPWPAEHDIEIIVQKSAGLFIFATTVIKFVRDKYNSPVTRLQAVLQGGASTAASSSVYSDLDKLYFDALRIIPDADRTRLVLGFVVFAFSPLSTRGLNNLLWKLQIDASFVIKSLRSVLVTSDTGDDGAVGIYHTSFRDFLTTPYRSRQYFVDAVTYHRIVAQACVESMIRHLTADMCKLGDASILNSEVENLGELCKLRIDVGVRYACRWFAHHLSHVPKDTVVNDTLIQCVQGFARGYLLNWIEVLSLMGELESAIISLREIADWLKSTLNPHQETLELLQDTERLVLMFFDPIQQAALQVYYSVPYAPKRVQLRTTYQRELMNKFTITSGLDDIWNPCVRSVLTANTIKSLAISASGCLFASAGGTPGVQMWDSLTGRNVGHFTGRGTSSSCPVMFSPSGDYVAVGCDTGAMDVWDVATGQQLLDPDQGTHQASVTVIAFSWNSSFIASGSTDATVHIWDISTRSLRHSLAYHEGPIRCLLFSFNDSLIASGSDDRLLITSNTKSGQLVRKMKGHSAKINSISFSTDNSSIASGSDDQAVRLWDIRTGVCLQTYTGSYKKPVTHVWISADNKHLVSVCDMGIDMWQLGSRKSPQRIWSVEYFYRKMATIFPAWYAKLVRLCPSKMFGRLFEMDDGTPLCPVFSPNGDVLGFIYSSFCFSLDYSVITQGRSRIRNLLTSSPTLDETPLLAGESSEPFTAIAMAPDSTQLITFSGGAIQIWNTTLPRISWKDVQDNMRKSVEGFWPAPDGRSVLIKPFIGLSLFTSAGTLIKELETGGDNLGKVGASVSPDSQYYAYWAEYTWNVDQSFSIHIYETTTGVRLKRFPGLFKIECVTFSADSKFVACGHGDGIIQVWELPSGLSKATVDTGHAAITSLTFIPGDIALVAGSEEGHVEIRLVESGDILHQVQCATAKVSALATSMESSLVVVGHADGSLYLWDPPAAKVNLHCLSPKDTSDSTNPDGVDLIKFTDNYRSACSRSKKGIISTWDLSPFLDGGGGKEVLLKAVDGHATGSGILPLPDNLSSSDPSHGSEYGEGGKEVLPKAVDGHATGSGILPLPDNLSFSDPSHGSAALDAPDATPAGCAGSDSVLAESSASESAEFQSKTFDSTTSETDTSESTTADGTTPLITSCPHLLSRSDSNIIYDIYLSSTYSVHCQEGWVYRGSRRMVWLPDEFRPVSPTSFSAIDDRVVIFTKSGERLVFFDFRPMVGTSLPST